MNPDARAWADTRCMSFSSEKPGNGLELYIAAADARINDLPTDHLNWRLS